MQRAWSLLVLLPPATAVAAAAAASSSDNRPHLIFAMVDDWGRYNAGFRGNTFAKTPAIDSLVREEGLDLERHYTYKYCSPTRRSFLTGRFPPHSGEANDASATIDYRMSTIADELKAAGYATAHAGKWHGGHNSMAEIPHARGFDTSLGYFNGAETHWTQQDTEDCGHNVTDLWNSDRPGFGLNNTGYGDEMYVQRAMQVILNVSSAPLFLYLAFQCAHAPMEAPARFVQMHSDSPSPYEYAMVSLVDEAIGNITVILKDRGMWNNTLMVVASDNGGPAFSDQHAASNWPLRGGKYSFLEGGLRTNAFVTGGLLPKERRGKVLDAPIHVCDWYSTFLGLARTSVLLDRSSFSADEVQPPPLDSVDQWPVIVSGKATVVERELFLGSGVVALGRWKLIATDTGRQSTTSNNTQWSGPLYPQVPAFGDGSALSCSKLSPCLFDVVDDPSEVVDLSQTFPHIVSKLAQRLDILMLTVFEGQAATRYNSSQVCEATRRQGGYLTPADYFSF